MYAVIGAQATPPQWVSVPDELGNWGLFLFHKHEQDEDDDDDDDGDGDNNDILQYCCA